MRSGRAHPHSRGENPVSEAKPVTCFGSSPLTRGKPVDLHERQANLRLIPTHAGKTSARSFRRSSGGAHPHSRGENMRPGLSTPRPASSSPLTRGKLARPLELERAARLIPAHAGKTPWTVSLSISRPAHPRSRGENARNCTPSSRTRGSSPLTRGKPGRST